MKLEEKTIDALRWIVGILNKHSIEYQIAGGFAAKMYGSERPLHDIDFEIHDDDIPKILPEISKYITYGPARFKNKKWDCLLVTLIYNGQEIDIDGADTLKMSNLEGTEWISYGKSSFNTLTLNVEGIDINVIHPQELVSYKKELGDREHQKTDVQAVEKYIKENNIN